MSSNLHIHTHTHTQALNFISLWQLGNVPDLFVPNHQRFKEGGQSSNVSARKTVRVEAVTQEQEEPLQSLP